MVFLLAKELLFLDVLDDAS